MASKRRRVWIGFAVFAALAILALFVLHGAAAGVASLAAMLALIGAGIYALRGNDAEARKHGDRTGLAGWIGGWF
jgi:hypothetical protein